MMLCVRIARISYNNLPPVQMSRMIVDFERDAQDRSQLPRPLLCLPLLLGLPLLLDLPFNARALGSLWPQGR